MGKGKRGGWWRRKDENGSDGRTDREAYVGNDVMDMWYRVEGSSTRRRYKQATEKRPTHTLRSGGRNKRVQ
jgi:hypothetical protein